jgi:hypothetical protein
MKGAAVAYPEVLIRRLDAGTEEGHEESQWRLSCLQSEFEPRTTPIRSTSTTNFTAEFGKQTCKERVEGTRWQK